MTIQPRKGASYIGEISYNLRNWKPYGPLSQAPRDEIAKGAKAFLFNLPGPDCYVRLRETDGVGSANHGDGEIPVPGDERPVEVFAAGEVVVGIILLGVVIVAVGTWIYFDSKKRKKNSTPAEYKKWYDSLSESEKIPAVEPEP